MSEGSRGGGSGRSGGLAPSKSTVYVSNLPFALTNNDLHKIFEKYGRVGKVTVAKDKVTRQSKGVAFVLFVERESAYRCIDELHDKEMFGRTIKCSIAKDNGRAAEFIRRKVYKDKVRCYECGEEGHLSYACPHNLLGEREPPPKKEKKKRKKGVERTEGQPYTDESGSDAESQILSRTQPDSLAAAISYQQEKILEEELSRYGVSNEGDGSTISATGQSRKRYKKDAYFSDEEELD